MGIPAAPIIEVRDVIKEFPEVRAVHGVSFDVILSADQTTGGKSTT